MAAHNLTKGELLRRLRASKRPVTARQLERWWKHEGMSRPSREHVPGVRGSVSVFPSEAFAQAAALYDAGHPDREANGPTDRRLDERAFLLWWSGKAIVQPVPTLLLRLASPFLDALGRVQAEGGSQVVNGGSGDVDPAFDIAEANVAQYRHKGQRGPLFRTLFANLGRKNSDMVSVMITVLTGALGGSLFLGASHTGEASLAALVLRAFGFADFRPGADPESEGQEMLGALHIFADRYKLTEFAVGLTEEELAMSRKCVRAVLEDLPVIYESYGLLMGRHSATRILQAFSRTATAAFKATWVLGMAWALRKRGTLDAIRMLDQIEDALPRAKALLTLADAFPEYRKLLLQKNAKRLAALPEETRKKMVDILKPSMT